MRVPYFGKTRLVSGRHYIDTSDTSSMESGAVGTAEGKGAEERPSSSEGMVAFVAADLNARIRMASPPQSTASDNSSPSPYPPLAPDPQILIDLEAQARQIGSQLDRVLTEFKGSLHGMTDLSVETMDVYTDCIESTCDTVDLSIKSMYQLLAKYEELSRSLKPVPKMAQQVREIKRVLDLFEAHLQKTP